MYRPVGQYFPNLLFQKSLLTALQDDNEICIMKPEKLDTVVIEVTNHGNATHVITRVKMRDHVRLAWASVNEIPFLTSRNEINARRATSPETSCDEFFGSVETEDANRVMILPLKHGGAYREPTSSASTSEQSSWTGHAVWSSPLDTIKGVQPGLRIATLHAQNWQLNKMWHKPFLGRWESFSRKL
jgi:hypothetical protein